MAQAPPKKRGELFHAVNHHERLKLVKTFLYLHEHTPLPTVLQDVVVEFLKGATTLFVSDWGKGVVFAVDLENKNAVRVLAGKSGEEGHVDGRGSEARFTYPGALAVDPASGDLLVCSSHRCIRRVASDGTVSTLCGDPNRKGYREGVGSAARFSYLSGCAVIGKDLFVCDTDNHCIRRIPLDGSSTSLFAGSPVQPGCDDGVGTEAKFHYPTGMCQDGSSNPGNLIVADCYKRVIRKITPAGVVTTLAGSGERGSEDGPAKKASFDWPRSVAYDVKQNRVLVCEQDKGAFRSIDLCTNQVSTIPLEIVPRTIAVDCTGDAYVSTSNFIYRVAPDGRVDVVLKGKGFTGYRIGAFLQR